MSMDDWRGFYNDDEPISVNDVPKNLDPTLKWSEVVRWLEKWGIEVENKAFDELKEIING